MTANQMKYLLSLIRQEKPSITRVAQIHGVNKSTVSRTLAACAQKGILDQEYHLTKYGDEYVKAYQKQFGQIYNLLKMRGIGEENAREDTFVLLEGCSEETLEMLGQSGEFCRVCEYFQAKGRRVSIEGSDMCEYVSEGVYEVAFIFHKDKKRGPEQISMANDAFVHPMKMIIKKNKSKLCLKLKKIKQESLFGKIQLEGKLKSMCYEENGQVKQQIHIDDDTAHIPLSALKFIYIKEDHILQGYVRLIVTCTVGTIHMPKSTAMLTVYL